MDTSYYNNGLRCSWQGVKVVSMDRDQLISFIGQLDFVIRAMERGETEWQPQKEKLKIELKRY